VVFSEESPKFRDVEEEAVLRSPDIVDRHDGRMIEEGEEAGFS